MLPLGPIEDNTFNRYIKASSSPSSPKCEILELGLKLRLSFSLEDWAKFESSLTPLRLKFFLGHEKVKSFVPNMLSKYPSKTDKSKGMRLKNIGNKEFCAANYEAALESYNKCLAWMPQDDGSPDAAIVYANRSAALFHLSQYKLAERDALLAFQLGYPVDLHYKLYERLARCCLELGKRVEASKHLQKAIQALRQAKGLDETKLEKTRSTLETLSKSCLSEKDNISLHGDLRNDDGNAVLDLPEVVGGRSKYLKACSKALKLKCNEKKGRFMVSTEALHPGDVILVEKAYVSVLNPKYYHRQCFQCFSPLEAPIFCSSCIYASYCSIECRDKSNSTHHQYECEFLGVLKHSGTSEIVRMALRMLTQANPEDVLEWYNLIAQKEENKKDISKDISTMEYKSDHTSIFNLATNAHLRSAENDFHDCLPASYLVNILKSTEFFRKLSKGTDISGEVELKVGIVLHRCLQFLQFNAHAIGAWTVGLPTNNSEEFGSGLFPTLSLFNHSCYPSIVRYNVNDTVVVQALRTIFPWEEVTEDYGQNFYITEKSERKQYLLEQYWFECECVACTQDWPTFDKLLEDTYRFRCHHCGAFLCHVEENMCLQFKCGQCSKSVNIAKRFKSLQELDKKFKKLKQIIDSYQGGDGANVLQLIFKCIALTDTVLMPPLKNVHMLQEHVRRYLLSSGNKLSKHAGWEPEKI